MGAAFSLIPSKMHQCAQGNVTKHGRTLRFFEGLSRPAVGTGYVKERGDLAFISRLELAGEDLKKSCSKVTKKGWVMVRNVDMF